MFQSTLPIREETAGELRTGSCGGVSIHSSHTGRDPWFEPPSYNTNTFQSTLPIREETAQNPSSPDGMDISIHSSHTGRDGGIQCSTISDAYFNPLFPYGKRQEACQLWVERDIFQSTLPIREETILQKKKGGVQRIFQSTLPIREETLQTPMRQSGRSDFNPLFPYGKRHDSVHGPAVCADISIHSSHTGRDAPDNYRTYITKVFQSTLPIREETLLLSQFRPFITLFNPLFPYGKRLIQSKTGGQY